MDMYIPCRHGKVCDHKWTPKRCVLQMRLDYVLIMYIVQSSQQHLRVDVMIFKERESTFWSLRISCASTLIVKLEMTIFATCYW
jgi:hypothetical protein